MENLEKKGGEERDRTERKKRKKKKVQGQNCLLGRNW